MPIYEYRRPDGSTFEVQQSFSDEPLKVDPDSGVPVQRVLHPPAVHFKGKGFYNTDYGTRKRQREAAADKSSSGGSGGAASDSAAGSDGKGKAEGGKGEGAKGESGKGSSPKEGKAVASKG